MSLEGAKTAIEAEGVDKASFSLEKKGIELRNIKISEYATGIRVYLVCVKLCIYTCIHFKAHFITCIHFPDV